MGKKGNKHKRAGILIDYSSGFPVYMAWHDMIIYSFEIDSLTS